MELPSFPFHCICSFLDCSDWIQACQKSSMEIIAVATKLWTSQSETSAYLCKFKISELFWKRCSSISVATQLPPPQLQSFLAEVLISTLFFCQLAIQTEDPLLSLLSGKPQPGPAFPAVCLENCCGFVS